MQPTERKTRSNTAATRSGRNELGTGITQDTDIYTASKYHGYATTISASDQADDDQEQREEDDEARGRFSITAPQELLDEIDAANSAHETAQQRAREQQQQQASRHVRRELPAEGSYAEKVRKAQLEREEASLVAKIQRQDAQQADAQPAQGKRKWDDQTPAHPSAVDATPRRSRWDETPADVHGVSADATPKRTRSRWDETPAGVHVEATPRRAGSRWDETPAHVAPVESVGVRAPAMAARNQPMSDADLDALLPAAGFTIVDPPAAYVPLRTPARRQQLQLQQQQPAGFHMGDAAPRHALVASAEDALGGAGALPAMAPDDMQYFAPLLDGSTEDTPERQVLRLLLR
ncbi:U2 snRNP component prp10, partial [Coemansia sp. RSA 2607]